MEKRILKLSRVAALLRPAILICAGIFWLFFIIIGAMEAKGDLRLFALYSLEGLSLPLVIFLSVAFLNTRRIALDRDFMEFNYLQSAPSNNMSRRNRRVKVKYTVTGIEDLRFGQNALEKLFNCGHFSFKGNTVYESNSEGFEPLTEFTFYGLTRFRQTKKEICDVLGVNESE